MMMCSLSVFCLLSQKHKLLPTEKRRLTKCCKEFEPGHLECNKSKKGVGTHRHTVLEESPPAGCVSQRQRFVSAHSKDEKGMGGILFLPFNALRPSQWTPFGWHLIYKWWFGCIGYQSNGHLSFITIPIFLNGQKKIHTGLIVLHLITEKTNVYLITCYYKKWQ